MSRLAASIIVLHLGGLALLQILETLRPGMAAGSLSMPLLWAVAVGATALAIRLGMSAGKLPGQRQDRRRV